jgi:hypothetical protein
LIGKKKAQKLELERELGSNCEFHLQQKLYTNIQFFIYYLLFIKYIELHY